MFKFRKNDSSIYSWGILGGVLEALYCLLVLWVMPQLERSASNNESVLTIMPMLLIMVFSVAVSGLLIFGYPVKLVIEQKYGRAVACVLISLLTLAIIGAIIILFKN